MRAARTNYDSRFSQAFALCVWCVRNLLLSCRSRLDSFKVLQSVVGICSSGKQCDCLLLPWCPLGMLNPKPRVAVVPMPCGVLAMPGWLKTLRSTTWRAVFVAVRLFQLHPVYLRRSSLRTSAEYFDVLLRLLQICSLLHFWSNYSNLFWLRGVVRNDFKRSLLCWTDWRCVGSVINVYRRKGSFFCVCAGCVQQKTRFSTSVALHVVCSTTFGIICFQVRCRYAVQLHRSMLK